MFQVNQYSINFQNCVTIMVTQNNCSPSVCLLGTQIHTPVTSSVITTKSWPLVWGLLWAQFKTLVMARQSAEAITCTVHPRYIYASAAPEITLKKSLRQLF